MAGKLELNEIFHILLVLERNKMNKMKSARELGVSTTTVIKYHKSHWKSYLENKQKLAKPVIPKIPVIEVVDSYHQKELFEGEDIEAELSDSYVSAMRLMTNRIKCPTASKKITNSQLINYIDNLSPYFKEKKGEAGKDDKSPTHNNFIQNFVNQMNNITPTENNNQ